MIYPDSGAMMPLSLTVTEVARHFSDVINRVVYRRERILLLRGKRAVAELRPVQPVVRARDLPALFATMPHLDDDDAAAFAADIDSARAALNVPPASSAWDSEDR
jgi:antitoxin (DNA-binding transcriptional repressor) of toxin-antitoxin stability system